MQIKFFFSLCVLQLTIEQASSLRIKRIVGYEDLNNKFKYQVSIQNLNSNGHFQNTCGGSIIGEKFVLSAAHCFFKKNKYTVDIKEDIVNNFRIEAGTEDILAGKGLLLSIRAVYLHEDYPELIRDIGNNDIAVIKLQTKLRLDLHENLEKLDLPRGPRLPATNLLGVTSGFGCANPACGKVANAKPEMPWQRRYLIMKIDEVKSNGLRVHAVSLPHSVNNQRTCYGDSGNPLVIKDTNILIGVLRGQNPYSLNETFFVDVSKFLNFIDQAMNDRQNRIGAFLFKPKAPAISSHIVNKLKQWFLKNPN